MTIVIPPYLTYRLGKGENGWLKNEGVATSVRPYLGTENL